MRCNVNNKIKELKYMIWNGTNYSPDCSNDLLDDGLNKHDEFGNTIYTEEEYETAVDFLEECAEEENKIHRSNHYEACVLTDQRRC